MAGLAVVVADLTAKGWLLAWPREFAPPAGSFPDKSGQALLVPLVYEHAPAAAIKFLNQQSPQVAQAACGFFVTAYGQPKNEP